MSDSSTSSAGIERVAARLRLLAPDGRTEVFAERAGDAENLDALAFIASDVPATPSGFKLVLEKAHRRPCPLGEVLGEKWMKLPLPHGVKTGLAKLGHASGFAHVVGHRVTQVVVPGKREYYFARTDLSASSGSRTSSLAGDLFMSSGGLGHLPIVGATAASAAVAILGLVTVSLFSPDTWKLLMLLLAVVSTTICAVGEKWAHRHYLAEDPREVVLDEVAGMALALAITGPGLWTIIAAFFAFRFFDILKPGIHWIEKRGWPGIIVWDDLLAGIYAGGLVKGLWFLIGFEAMPN
jgi:phosphatidylglycerophosphatase A